MSSLPLPRFPDGFGWGVTGYRFSIAWPRARPAGTGPAGRVRPGRPGAGDPASGLGTAT
ncbi:MAG: hypothetical protein ACLPKI_20310 [Streptosporangiaceae bacterium]